MFKFVTVCMKCQKNNSVNIYVSEKVPVKSKPCLIFSHKVKLHSYLFDKCSPPGKKAPVSTVEPAHTGSQDRYFGRSQPASEYQDEHEWQFHPLIYLKFTVNSINFCVNLEFGKFLVDFIFPLALISW